MELVFALAGLGVLLLPLVISIRRSTELFKLKVRGGETRFVRGRMPQSLLSDIDDVVRLTNIERADLLAVRRGGRAELIAEGGLTREQIQRLRNVVSSYTLPRIAAGGRPARAQRRRK
jgi:hypothetical protein